MIGPKSFEAVITVLFHKKYKALQCMQGIFFVSHLCETLHVLNVRFKIQSGAAGCNSIVTFTTTIYEDKIAGLSLLIIQVFMHLKRVLDCNSCQPFFACNFLSFKIVLNQLSPFKFNPNSKWVKFKIWFAEYSFPNCKQSAFLSCIKINTLSWLDSPYKLIHSPK